jgi:hypothetical protein
MQGNMTHNQLYSAAKVGCRHCPFGTVIPELPPNWIQALDLATIHQYNEDPLQIICSEAAMSTAAKITGEKLIHNLAFLYMFLSTLCLLQAVYSRVTQLQRSKLPKPYLGY